MVFGRQIRALLMALAINVASAGLAMGSAELPPQFSLLAGAVEAQPIENPAAALVYWDQAAADALGIDAPAGRVGQGAFNEWAKRHFGWEVKEGAARFAAGAAPAGHPHLFVELDGEGGAGRAGYLRLPNGAWVNLKGVGRTGYGRVAKFMPSPPSENFSNHTDGSATLAEAIKEAIYARVTDNDTSRGGSRVVAILATGRKLHYPDGGTAPEALIIRAPMNRAFQSHDTAAIVDSVAELNAKRFMKGDLVNRANIGSAGQLVDFGCLTHTCDYIPAASSQGVLFLNEHVAAESFWDGSVNQRDRFGKSLGRYLANQIGIPEAHLQGIDEGLLKRFGYSFHRIVANEAAPVLLDFKPVPELKLRSMSRALEWMPSLAAEFFRKPHATREEYVARMLALQGRASQAYVESGLKPKPDLEAGMKKESEKFFGQAYDLFRSIRTRHLTATRAPSYAANVARVARFKLRPVPALLRPELSRRAGEAADRFARDPNPALVQELIDEIAQNNRVSTGPFADGLLRVAADERETRIHIRAARGDAGKVTIVSHPELPGGAAGDQHFVRLSTDGWKTYQDFPAALSETDGRLELVARVPHDAKLPVTEEPLRFSPFWKSADGAEHWPSGADLSFTGPPLFLNERMGLPADLPRVPDAMLAEHGVRVRPEIPGPRPARPTGRTCSAHFGRLWPY